MEERKQFISDWLGQVDTMEELCARYGVSRQTGHKWVRRLVEDGVDGFKEHSRRPHTSPLTTSPEVIDALLALKARHPGYGPKKLVGLLKEQRPELKAPAASTVGEALKKRGLVKARRMRRSTPAPVGSPLTIAREPNDVWCADFKGEFKLRDGKWCWPLTITDGATRFLVRCTALASPTIEASRPVFESAFRELGLPRAIRTDNGTPFSSPGNTGLTRLSAMWIRHGVAVQRTRPGKPQDNGRHERFHRTLKEATVIPPGNDLDDQQARFDSFKREYNDVRPHEALNQIPPSRLYVPSARRYIEPPKPHDYPAFWTRRQVDKWGRIYLRKNVFILVGEGLAGQVIALEPIDASRTRIHFAWYAVGELDVDNERFRPYGPQMPAPTREEVLDEE